MDTELMLGDDDEGLSPGAPRVAGFDRNRQPDSAGYAFVRKTQRLATWWDYLSCQVWSLPTSLTLLLQ